MKCNNYQFFIFKLKWIEFCVRARSGPFAYQHWKLNNAVFKVSLNFKIWYVSFEIVLLTKLIAINSLQNYTFFIHVLQIIMTYFEPFKNLQGSWNTLYIVALPSWGLIGIDHILCILWTVAISTNLACLALSDYCFPKGDVHALLKPLPVCAIRFYTKKESIII